MKIGVLTGGGDAPGLNAVIRAVVRKCLANGHEMVGIREGWRGILENKYEVLDRNSISGIWKNKIGNFFYFARIFFRIYSVSNGTKISLWPIFSPLVNHIL